MRFRFLLTLTAFAALAAPAAHAATPLRIAWKPARTNYTAANRPSSLIRKIVIHATEGGYFGSIQWLRNPKAKASAHYVVSRKGEIAQLVRDTDIAWHAGNWAINRESIGIEHEGYTYRPGTFTDAEYRASARLVGWLARRYLLPTDRRHIIGHSEVPDPNHRGSYGGFAHHMDPGKYWQWSRYMAYVRAYARGAKPPVFKGSAPRAAPKQKPTVIRPGGKAPQVGSIFAFAGLSSGASLSGFVPWRAKVAGKGVSRVEFLVDGRLRWTDRRAPYRYHGDRGALDTTQLANGRHLLAIRVHAAKGKVSGSSVRVRVVNTPFQVSATQPANGELLSGKVQLRAAVAGGTADRVEFVLDGRLVHTERAAPFEDALDTSGLADGAHTLTLRAVAQDGRVATTSVTVLVKNAPSAPTLPPAPTHSAFEITRMSLADGQTVSGAVRWSVDVQGRAARVEYWIDGELRWTERSRPFRFNGDGGRWDTWSESDGTHVLIARAYAPDGDMTDVVFVVTVANRGWRDGGGSGSGSASRSATAAAPSPPPVPLAVALGVHDGDTVKDVVRVVASTEGAPDRVEFRVDGVLRHTEGAAPYQYDWDTRRDRDGTHTLRVDAVSRTGRATASATVTTANAPPLSVSIPYADGQTVDGRLHLVAAADGSPSRVEFRVDGVLRHTERAAPYEWDWDTTRERDGVHTLRVEAIAGDRRATASAELTVANAPPPPPPPPPPAPDPEPDPGPAPDPGTTPAPAELAVSTGLVEGTTLSGTVHVEGTVTGSARRVEFWVDGWRVHVERDAPYTFDWKTWHWRDGDHVLVVRAVGADGTRAETTVPVVLANRR